MGRPIITHKGDFSKIEGFLKKFVKKDYRALLSKYGEIGVEALSMATPVKTGKTSSSWTYEIEINHGNIILRWINSNVVDHVNIAMILQYGHGTRNGGYVKGIDYVNPALQPIFDQLTDQAWKEVCDS